MRRLREERPTGCSLSSRGRLGACVTQWRDFTRFPAMALHAVRACALVQADRRGRRDVEALGAAWHRYVYAMRRRCRQIGGQPTGLRTEQPPGRLRQVRVIETDFAVDGG